MLRHILFALCVLFGLTASVADAVARSSWDEVRELVFEDSLIAPAGDYVELETPYRPTDQSNVPVRLATKFIDGRQIRKITLIVDENPMPVAAVFDMGEGRNQVSIESNIRLNSATHVRAIVEASDGQLYMAKRFVKFAGGQAACAAPPNGSAQEIAQNMGKMKFATLPAPAGQSLLRPKAMVKVSHPNHTGMVMDQVTLHAIPMKLMTNMVVRLGEDLIFKMQGSMSLSQDPQVTFNYRPNGAARVHVLVEDSDGESWRQNFPVGAGS